ncbi:MAG: Fe-S cluster assembly sulfur transfer protein SufU [Acidobacteriota bacterium]
MSNLRDLYQEVILDHAKKPKNFGPLEGDDVRSVRGFNPLCGDHYTVHVRVADGRVEAASFEGEGCAISKASASLMTDTLVGRTLEEAETLHHAFNELVTAEPTSAGERFEDAIADLGKLAVFAGVCEYPSRVKCASLAWHACRSALTEEDDTVTTE